MASNTALRCTPHCQGKPCKNKVLINIYFLFLFVMETVEWKWNENLQWLSATAPNHQDRRKEGCTVGSIQQTADSRQPLGMVLDHTLPSLPPLVVNTLYSFPDQRLAQRVSDTPAGEWHTSSRLWHPQGFANLYPLQPPFYLTFFRSCSQSSSIFYIIPSRQPHLPQMALA